MDTLKKTAMHTLELLIVIAAAYLIVSIFKIDDDSFKALIAIAIGALAKFARSSDSVPLKDYVNEV